jgi:predicted secreted protein
MAGAGCAAAPDNVVVARASSPAFPAARQVGAEQNGSTITLPVGGELIVGLRGNRSTGYYWAEASTPAQLAAAGDDYVQDSAPAGMVGVGGVEQFKFRATRPGTGRLRLEQRGAGNRGVADTWSIQGVVR